MVSDPLTECAVLVMHHVDRVPVVRFLSLMGSEPVLRFGVIDDR